jgi:phospholipase/lecithinase/hemolysin
MPPKFTVQRKIISVGIFLCTVIFPLKVSAQNYDEIYVFGDSLSDTGNVFNITKGTIPPSPTYFDGRFSNGPVWVEYLASDLGLTFNPKTNFAYGGATTGSKNIGITGLPGLQQQISSFTSTNPSVNPNALYIIWAGLNDYVDSFFVNIPDSTPSVTQVINQAVHNLSASLTSLVAVGAKNIMVVNLPDLGKFPVAGNNNQVSTLVSNSINIHNSSLTTNLSFLSHQLNPDINIISLDVNSLINRIIADPEEFGFTNVTESCVGNLSVIPINISLQSVVCNPDKFLFWDQVHPTAATHQIIGELAFSLLKPVSVPEPSIMLGLFAFANLGAVLLLKRK